MKAETLEDRLSSRIKRARRDVFLRSDFDGLGGYDQIGRVLRKLVQKGLLLKLGHGIYSRARASSLDGKLYPPNGLRTLKEALHRLGIETEPTQAELSYNAGRTEQVPTGRVVAVRKRVRRKVGYDGFFLGFERAGVPSSLWPTGPSPGAKPAERGQQENETPITVREVLRLLLEADSYPCLGNGDWRVCQAMEADALKLTPQAIPSPDDPPEFGRWMETLLKPHVTGAEKDEIYDALHEFFEPEPAEAGLADNSRPP